jgi:glycosyltransferase involved in cell wall biosynthesis
MFRQSAYRRTSGLKQVAALHRCLNRTPPSKIFIHRLQSMCPLLSLKTERNGPQALFDLDDVEHFRFVREIGEPPRWRSKPLLYLHTPALIWGERSAIRRAAKTFVCSDLDQNYLSRIWRLPGIVTIPNSVPIPAVAAVPDSKQLLFLGRYSHQPNAVAADYLITTIWPIVRREVPDATLVIAGEGPERIPAFAESLPGVTFLGFVESLADLYANTRLVCAPIRSGGGTRVKLVEAAAYGRPIVSSFIGAEGLPLIDGESVLIRNKPEDFAAACVTLLRDRALATRIGTAARDVAQVHFDRRAIIAKIEREFFGDR